MRLYMSLHFLFNKNIEFLYNFYPYTSDEANIDNMKISTLRVIFLKVFMRLNIATFLNLKNKNNLILFLSLYIG